MKMLITINYFGKMEPGVLCRGRRSSRNRGHGSKEPQRMPSLGGARLASRLACG